MAIFHTRPETAIQMLRNRDLWYDLLAHTIHLKKNNSKYHVHHSASLYRCIWSTSGLLCRPGLGFLRQMPPSLFDPLCSQGIFNAIDSGMTAAHPIIDSNKGGISGYFISPDVRAFTYRNNAGKRSHFGKNVRALGSDSFVFQDSFYWGGWQIHSQFYSQFGPGFLAKTKPGKGNNMLEGVLWNKKVLRTFSVTLTRVGKNDIKKVLGFLIA